MDLSYFYTICWNYRLFPHHRFCFVCLLVFFPILVITNIELENWKKTLLRGSGDRQFALHAVDSDSRPARDRPKL